MEQIECEATGLKMLAIRTFRKKETINLGQTAGRGGSSSGSVSDYGSRGPRFESHWELGFFLFSSLSCLSISGAS